MDFLNACKTIPINDRADHWKWLPSTHFSVQSATHALNPPFFQVPWTKIVWGGFHLSRYAIILWCAFWKRLPTLQKLANWGVVDSARCKFCNAQSETQEHLFFNCPFSYNVWTVVLGKANNPSFAFFLDSIQDWILATHWSSNFQKNLVCFVLSTTVYCIWKERNQRIHTNLQRDSHTIASEILQNIRMSASSWRKIRKTQKNWQIAVSLGIPMTIFRT